MHIRVNQILWFYNKNENEKDHNESGLDINTIILNLKGISVSQCLYVLGNSYATFETN